MENNKNIEMFDIFASYIFEKTYKEFPKCINIEIQKELKILLDELDASLSFDEKSIIFTESVLWLSNNGFIRYAHPNIKRPIQPVAIESFMCVELTLKGLNLLKSPIPQTLTQKTVGNEIIEKFKEGSISEAGKLTMNAILSTGANKILGSNDE